MSRFTNEELDRLFTSVEAQQDSDTAGRMKEVGDYARALAGAVVRVTPPGADQSAAIRKLREVVWTVNDAICKAGPAKKGG